MKACDNFSRTHNPVICSADENADRYFCAECGNYVFLRKDADGKYLQREADALFKRLSLQPGNPLFYKYYPHYLRQ